MRTVDRGKTVRRRSEMPLQDRAFAHAIIIEKTIGRLRVRPVLTGHRQAFADRPCHTFKQLAKAVTQTCIRKTTTRQLRFDPLFIVQVIKSIPEQSAFIAVATNMHGPLTILRRYPSKISKSTHNHNKLMGN